MTLKINKAEFMFGKKAGELQRQLEEETGVKWDIERTCTFDIDNGVDAYVCSECSCFEYEPDVLNFNYCPNCGAKVVDDDDRRIQ